MKVIARFTDEECPAKARSYVWSVASKQPKDPNEWSFVDAKQILLLRSSTYHARDHHDPMVVPEAEAKAKKKSKQTQQRHSKFQS